jgi:hypothetical protein
LKVPEKDDNDEKGDGRKGDKIPIPSSKVLHPLGVQFHHHLSPFPHTHPLRLERGEEDLLKKEEKDRRDHPRKKGLGKEGRKEWSIKVSERHRIKSGQEGQEKEAFKQSKDKDEKGLRQDALKVESTFEQMSQIEEKGAGEGVEAEGISREKIHEISQKESVDSS